jgi:hypothetical protein
MQDYPLIAMGRMLWLSQQVKQPVESLTKPAPIQALAAIAAALTGREAAALTAAYQLSAHGKQLKPFDQLRDHVVEVWAVEDATLGLSAARGAIEVLRRFGVDARLHSIGVARGGPKAAALAPWCEVVLPEVNAAVGYIAQMLSP